MANSAHVVAAARPDALTTLEARAFSPASDLMLKTSKQGGSYLQQLLGPRENLYSHTLGGGLRGRDACSPSTCPRRNLYDFNLGRKPAMLRGLTRFGIVNAPFLGLQPQATEFTGTPCALSVARTLVHLLNPTQTREKMRLHLIAIAFPRLPGTSNAAMPLKPHVPLAFPVDIHLSGQGGLKAAPEGHHSPCRRNSPRRRGGSALKAC